MEITRYDSYQPPAAASQFHVSGLIPPVAPALREYRQIDVAPYPSIPPVGRESLFLEDVESGFRTVGAALAGAITGSSHDEDDSSDDESNVSSHNSAASFVTPPLAVASAASIGLAGLARIVRRQLDHERVVALDERTRISQERIENAEFTAANREITQQHNADQLSDQKEQHRFIGVQLQHRLTACMAAMEAQLQHARDRDHARLQHEAMQHEVALATQQREERREERAQQALIERQQSDERREAMQHEVALAAQQSEERREERAQQALVERQQSDERREAMQHEVTLATQQREERQMTTNAECFSANQQLMAHLVPYVVNSLERGRARDQAYAERLFTQALTFAMQTAERGAAASNAVVIQEEAPRIARVPSRFAHLEQVLSQHSFLPLLAINQPLQGLTVYQLLVEKEQLSQSVGVRVLAQFELAIQIYFQRLTEKGKAVTIVHVVDEMLQCRKQHWIWKWIPQIFLGNPVQPNESLELSNFIIKCLSGSALPLEQAEWVLTELLAMYVDVARFFIPK